MEGTSLVSLSLILVLALGTVELPAAPPAARASALVPGAPVDAASLEGRAFLVPAGHKIVARAEDGRFVLDAAPVAAASVGLGPARDCLADVPGAYAPLTANAFAPALPRLASAGGCTGAVSLNGPVSYLEFHASGRGGGAIHLWTTGARFSVYCAAPGSVASAGAGAAWHQSDEASQCEVWREGDWPSQWSWFEGAVENGSTGAGAAYGLAAI